MEHDKGQWPYLVGGPHTPPHIAVLPAASCGIFRGDRLQGENSPCPGHCHCLSVAVGLSLPYSRFTIWMVAVFYPQLRAALSSRQLRPELPLHVLNYPCWSRIFRSFSNLQTDFGYSGILEFVERCEHKQHLQDENDFTNSSIHRCTLDDSYSSQALMAKKKTIFVSLFNGEMPFEALEIHLSQSFWGTFLVRHFWIALETEDFLSKNLITCHFLLPNRLLNSIYVPLEHWWNTSSSG